MNLSGKRQGFELDTYAHGTTQEVWEQGTRGTVESRILGALSEYRKKGRAGEIPESMARSLHKQTAGESPFKGLYLITVITYTGKKSGRNFE